MLRIIFPLILIVLAGVVFFVWTDPLISAPKTIDQATGRIEGGIQALREEREILSKAIGDARALKARISELESRLDQISSSQIARLDTFLPESIDGVQLVVDVNSIAGRSGLTIDNVRLTENIARSPVIAAQSSTERGPQAVPVNLSFDTIGSYSQIRSFISDLSRSLRIMDLAILSFTVNDERPTEYDFNITTYWIK